jgi:GMP synthase (glutamine-hydrolysing)
VFKQLGIDPQKAFGYKILEPLVQLRKDGVRKVAQALGLPPSVFSRMPFPGPALAARIIGEVTPEKIEMVRLATAITEEALASVKPVQCMAILHNDGPRAYGMVRGISACRSRSVLGSVGMPQAEPTKVPYETP